MYTCENIVLCLLFGSKADQKKYVFLFASSRCCLAELFHMVKGLLSSDPNITIICYKEFAKHFKSQTMWDLTHCNNDEVLEHYTVMFLGIDFRSLRMETRCLHLPNLSYVWLDLEY